MPYAHLLRGRVVIANHSYALTFSTAARRCLFTQPLAAQSVIAAIHRSAEMGYCGSLAFVVMPDHVHWLITLTGKCALSSLVAATKAEASRRLQSECALKLPIWQHGYYEHRVRADEDLLQQARYLVANPLRAGLVARLADYPYWFAVWAAPPHGPGPAGAPGEQLLER